MTLPGPIESTKIIDSNVVVGCYGKPTVVLALNNGTNIATLASVYGSVLDLAVSGRMNCGMNAEDD